MYIDIFFIDRLFGCMEDNSTSDDIVYEEPLTIGAENEWLTENKVLSYVSAPQESENFKVFRLKAAVEAAASGYDNSMWKWPAELIGDADEQHEFAVVQQVTHGIIGELHDESELGRIARASRDSRLVVVTFGVILQVLGQAGFLDESELCAKRPWQMRLITRACKYFCDIATGEQREHRGGDDVYFPRFMRSALVCKPTGSGKSLAGIVACLCSMIRSNGNDVTLLHPRNGKALWCVSTHTLVTDIENTFKRIVGTEAFKILAPSTIGNDIRRAYITAGMGSTSPDISERMFCVMTYEYGRSQLFNASLFDPGEQNAKRLPLIVSLRCVIVDEAHYLVSGGERAYVVDNILDAAYALHVPVLMLTATPTPQFTDFVVRTYPGDYSEDIGGQQRAHEIQHAAFAVPNINGSSLLNSAAIIEPTDKLIAFRCVTETFFNREQPGQRAIFFIQHIRVVQLLAAYMSGIHTAISQGGSWRAVAQYLNGKAFEYSGIELEYEDRFILDRVKPAELVEAFRAGVSDIAGSTNDGTAQQFSVTCAKKKNFITYLCLECGIVPYFSGIGRDEEAATRVRRMLIGGEANYRVVVTTSAVLEGVNIAGADNLYITPQGYQMITDTQYIQLAGRVGREKAGYVETWVPTVRNTDGGITPVKRQDVARRTIASEIDTIIETDDLIDRALFNRELASRIFKNIIAEAERAEQAGAEHTVNRMVANEVSEWSMFSTSVRRVGRNSITNNYYRGAMRPRMGMFYSPASLPADMREAESNGDEMDIMLYDKYFEQFSAPRYRQFFDIYCKVRFDPSPPRITLDALTFVNLIGTTEIRTHPCLPDRLLMPSIAFIPIFMRYSYAVNPARARTDKLATGYIAELNKCCDVEKVSSVSGSMEILSRVVSRLMPGETLTSDRMNKIELISTAFAVSLLVNPRVWHEVAGTKFADALPYVVTYLNTIHEQIERSGNEYNEQLANTVDCAWRLCNAICEALRNEIIDTFSPSTFGKYRDTNLLRDPVSISIKLSGSDKLSTIKLNISYVEYIINAMAANVELMENSTDLSPVTHVSQELVHRLPRMQAGGSVY